MNAWRAYLVNRISLDLRALTLLRTALFVCLAAQLWVNGIVALQAVDYLPLDLTLPWIRVLAASAIVLSLAGFGFGYRTRWSAFALWLSYAFFHVGPEVNGYHALTCALLLLCVFLPVGRYVSFDDAMDRGSRNEGQSPHRDDSVVSTATAAALLIVLGYVAMGVNRAPEFPLHPEQWHTAAGLFILASQLLPRSFDLLRVAAIGLFVAAMIDQGLNAGNVAAVFERALGVVLVTMLLPGSFFAWISNSRIFYKRHELRIYYDEPCGFCRKICYIFASFLMLGRCRIATAQSDEVAHKLLKDNDSWVVFDGNGHFELCWAAVLKVIRASPVWAPLGWLLTWIGMGKWGEPLYRLIGRSRSLLSKLTAAVLPYTSYRLELRSYEKVMIAVWSVLVLAHWTGASASLYGSVPDVLGIFGLDQAG